MDNSRRAIFDILENIERNDLLSDKVINEYLKETKFDKRDDNFIRKIVYGVLENKLLLNYYIETLTKRKLEKTESQVIILLQMGMYQIDFLDKVPNSAAVNEAVNLAKEINPRAKGFVNGVLRNFIRQIDKITINKKKFNEFLSIKYSYPIWMVKYFLDEFGEKKTEDIFKFNNKVPKLTVRVNTLKISREELINEFTKLNIESRKSTLTKSGIIIENLNNNSIDTLELFKNGYFYIQDDASIVVSEILAPVEGEKVLDVCASPGGKTTHIAEIMNDKGYILARDISNKKIDLIKENIERLEISSIKTEVFDAASDDIENKNKFDKILVDAPCSGLGIIRRKPDIKLQLFNRERLFQLSQLQLEILLISSDYVKKGGALIYSTCSTENEENREVVLKFLKRNPHFELNNLSTFNKKRNLSVNKSKENEFIKIYPGISNSNLDGFFMARMTKKGYQ
ncbi:MAG: 16S rRNA (cytosine(967)-C(5))-methyltransferase RsmB [Candidatus Caldatribacteriota bacterium]|nr:16S rRNA (cytosine(967)-C(5))-methyltransferase RsmB [Candidatus Caldatribacteriota bacterium]